MEKVISLIQLFFIKSVYKYFLQGNKIFLKQQDYIERSILTGEIRMIKRFASKIAKCKYGRQVYYIKIGES